MDLNKKRAHRTIEEMDIDNYINRPYKEAEEYEVELKDIPEYNAPKLGRRKLRDYTFKFIFSLDFHKAEKNVNENKEAFANELDKLVEYYCYIHDVLNEEDVKYIKNFTRIYVEDFHEIEDHIKSSLKSTWSITRISKVSLGLLKLAIIEILYENTPFRVAINEVIELSKKYQGTKQTVFVNGLLGEFVKLNKIEAKQNEKRHQEKEAEKNSENKEDASLSNVDELDNI